MATSARPTSLRFGAALAFLAVLGAGCGGDDEPADEPVDDSLVDDGAAPDDAADDESADDAPSGDAADDAGGAATASVDGTSWEFTEVLECQIGDDSSADFRQFIGTTADGVTRLDVAYFADDSLAGLDGVTIDTEVDGTDWTYASSYAGSDGLFDIDVQPDGANGTADARAVGLDAPTGDLTIEFSFSC